MGLQESRHTKQLATNKMFIHFYKDDSVCPQLNPLLEAIPYYPNQHFYQVCLGRQKMLSTLPQTFQVSLRRNYCICTYELGLQKTLRYTLFPTYHTVMKKTCFLKQAVMALCFEFHTDTRGWAREGA